MGGMKGLWYSWMGEDRCRVIERWGSKGVNSHGEEKLREGETPQGRGPFGEVLFYFFDSINYRFAFRCLVGSKDILYSLCVTNCLL
jgi:hypothetical protein